MTRLDKIGYGSASLADALSYQIVGTFLIFFLTTVAGISPITAGIISSVGTVWNAVFNPLMGYIADKVRTRYGRRRPVMMVCAVPLAILTVLLFTKVDLNTEILPVYYGAVLVLYWSFFTGFFVPYYALGMEYTVDYQERTTLRLYASFFNSIGGILAMSIPTSLVDLLERAGLSTAHAWSLSSGLLGTISAVSIIVTVVLSKDKDLPCSPDPEEKKEKFSLKSLFKEYFSILSIKPIQPLILTSLFCLISQTILISALVYILTYDLSLSSGGISLFMLIRGAASAALIPVSGLLIRLADKKNAMFVFSAAGSAGLVILRFSMNSSILWMGIFLVCCVLVYSPYWQIIPSVFYDVCEYDTIVNDKHREASIISLQGFVEALAAGIGSLITGALLQAAGFNGALAVQSKMTLSRIATSGTIVPIIFLALGMFALTKYPITKEYYRELLKEK